jgi:hypothetical protein
MTKPSAKLTHRIRLRPQHLADACTGSFKSSCIVCYFIPFKNFAQQFSLTTCCPPSTMTQTYGCRWPSVLRRHASSLGHRDLQCAHGRSVLYECQGKFEKQLCDFPGIHNTASYNDFEKWANDTVSAQTGSPGASLRSTSIPPGSGEPCRISLPSYQCSLSSHALSSLPSLKRKDSKQRNLTNALLLLPLLGTMTSVSASRTGELKLLHLSTVALPLLTTTSLLALSADAIIPLTNAVRFKISSLSTSRSSLTVPGLPRASLILAATRQGT